MIESERSNAKQFHFDPDTYLANIRREVPDYDTIQREIASAASANPITRFLDLGAGTGETSSQLLKMYPAAQGVLVEEQAGMCSLLMNRFKDFQVTTHQSTFALGIPDGPFCAAISAFAVHHLAGIKKKELFAEIFSALKPGGIWAFGDVFVPAAPAERKTPIDPKCDFPSTTHEVEAWLREVGFNVRKTWEHNDLAVYSCKKINANR